MKRDILRRNVTLSTVIRCFQLPYRMEVSLQPLAQLTGRCVRVECAEALIYPSKNSSPFTAMYGLIDCCIRPIVFRYLNVVPPFCSFLHRPHWVPSTSSAPFTLYGHARNLLTVDATPLARVAQLPFTRQRRLKPEQLGSFCCCCRSARASQRKGYLDFTQQRRQCGGDAGLGGRFFSRATSGELGFQLK